MKTFVKYLLILLVLYGCSKTATDSKAPSDYIAKVDDIYITEKDVKKQFDALPDLMKAIYNNPEGIGNLMDEVLKKELLYLEARKQGLDKSQEYREKLEEFQKLSLISMLLTKEIEQNVGIKDKEVKDYYDAHPEEFSTDLARASHILVRTKEKADSIFKRLKKGKGEDFAAIAKKESIDVNSAAQGGDLGYFKRGQMIPEFEKAVFSMKTGQISEPVKTQFGYHIIKLTDLKKGQKIEFEKVKENLSKKLLTEKQRAAFDRYIDKLKSSYTIEIKKEKLQGIKLAD